MLCVYWAICMTQLRDRLNWMPVVLHFHLVFGENKFGTGL